MQSVVLRIVLPMPIHDIVHDEQHYDLGHQCVCRDRWSAHDHHNNRSVLVCSLRIYSWRLECGLRELVLQWMPGMSCNNNYNFDQYIDDRRVPGACLLDICRRLAGGM